MKEIKKFILVNFIVLVITVIGGFVCKSNTMLSVGILDLLLLISSLCVTKRKENTKFKGVISSLLGFIFIMGSLAFLLYVYSSKVLIPSFFILLFMLITLVVKYLVSCFYTNINYQKKKGILSYGNLNSSVDFII